MPESASAGSVPQIAAVARSLASALDVVEVMHRVAGAAVELTRAGGAYVEQVVSARGTVEIVAAAGQGTPPLRTRVPFPGSLTEEMIRGALPVLLTEMREIGADIAPYLVQHCDGCSGMVAPLLAGQDVLGALVMLRSREQGPFSEYEVDQVRVLADLASVSLERVRLLEGSRREREQRTALLQSTAEGIYGIDREGRCTFLNRAGARLLGYEPDEVLGKNMHRLIHHSRPDGSPYPEAGCPIFRAAHTGQTVRVDDELLWRKDGTSFPAEYGSSPIREGGRIVGAVVTFQDITQRRLADQARERLLVAEREARGEAERRAREEAALREATRAVSASASTSEVIRRIAESAVTATNADGAFVERIDIERGEVAVVATTGSIAPELGAVIPYRGSFTEQVVERAEPAVLQHLRDSERALPADLAQRFPDCSAVVVPLADGGEPIGSLMLLRGPEKWNFRPDEVHRAHTFGELAALAFRKIHMLEDSEQRREELQRVMESRARLMRGFSHDVKNPLGAADGFLQLLEDGIMGELSDKQKESIGRARRAISNSLDLIEDLLELARAEAGQLEIEHVPVDVRDAVRELGEEYRAQAEAKGLRLVMELPDEMPVIESDATRVRQILGNLLSNAVKYTDEGQVEVATGVATKPAAGRAGEWIVTRVRDTGPGIAAEQQSLLFQEFTRLDPGDKKGAGVGLAISQRIARALGGEITVESRRGAGSTFVLWLPCTRGTMA